MPGFPPLRGYQKKAVAEVTESLKDHYSVVLSTCPSGGKTLMAAVVAERVLAEKKAVLVLTHGTNVLLAQWQDKMKSYGLMSKHLILVLPQSYRRIPELLAASGRPLGLLIVDEAHEFYHADKMVKRIVHEHKPEKELLLTGTPSKFIADNGKRGTHRPIILTAGVEVYTEGLTAPDGPYLQDTLFGVVRSAYTLTAKRDYNKAGDVKNTFTCTTADTQLSLDEMVGAMLQRMRQLQAVGGPPLGETTPWTKVFGRLEKTLIATSSIRQAKDVKDVLDARGVMAVLSDSDSDVDTVEIRRFSEDPAIKVLVVVNRGVLGFDLPALCNVVDMTCTRNINRIYQLYARVIRPNPSKNKFFFRLASALQPDLDAYYLQAALCLNSKDFILQYTGANLRHLKIPVKRVKGGNKGGASERFTATPGEALELVDLGMLAIKALDEGGSAWDEYCWVRFGNVIERLQNKPHTYSWGERLERCKRIFQETGKRPSLRLPEQQADAKWLNAASCPSGASFRPEVLAWLRSIKPRRGADRLIDAQMFYQKHGRLPSRRNPCFPGEKTLGIFLHTYGGGGRHSHPDVVAWKKSVEAELSDSEELMFSRYQAFYQKYNRQPRHTPTTPEDERVLGMWGLMRRRRGNPYFNPQFRAFYDSIKYCWEKRLEECKAFVAAHGRLPRDSKTASQGERRLAIWLSKLSGPTKYNPTVASWWAEQKARSLPQPV